MMNPGSLMKLMAAKNTFSNNHPKFVAFLSMMFSAGIEEDTIIEITVTKPGQAPVTSNMKVKQTDLELLEELKNMAK